MINALIRCQISSILNSDITQMIVQQHKLIYIINDDNDNKIHIHDIKINVDKNISISNIKKAKILLSLNEVKFILFGNENYNINSQLLFEIYNSQNDYNIIKNGIFEDIIFKSQINIKMINENQFLLYYFDNIKINFFKLNIKTSLEMNNNIYSLKRINFPSVSSFNTLKCETFNGENIICIYLLISSGYAKFYYFFNIFGGNEIKSIEIN